MYLPANSSNSIRKVFARRSEMAIENTNGAFPTK